MVFCVYSKELDWQGSVCVCVCLFDGMYVRMCVHVHTCTRTLSGFCGYGLQCWWSTPPTRQSSPSRSPTTSCSHSSPPALPRRAACVCWRPSVSVSISRQQEEHTAQERAYRSMGLDWVYRNPCGYLLKLFSPSPSIANLGELLQCELGNPCSGCLYCREAASLGPYYLHGTGPDLQGYVFPNIFIIQGKC